MAVGDDQHGTIRVGPLSRAFLRLMTPGRRTPGRGGDSRNEKRPKAKSVHGRLRLAEDKYPIAPAPANFIAPWYIHRMAFGSTKRLHVNIGLECNNNCIFCEEGDHEERRSRKGLITLENIGRLLESSGHRGQVMFTSGEPTLNPLLPDLVETAARLGYREVALTTNGRMLSYMPYARNLAEKGLNHIVFSIHQRDARRHDSLTRTPGSFAQSTAGLENACALKKIFPLTIHTSTVLAKRNLKNIREIYRLFSALPVDQIVFNCVKPFGRAAERFDSLVPRYKEVAAAVKGLLREEPGAAERIFLVGAPPCTATGLPPRVGGYVEKYRFYEAKGGNIPGRQAGIRAPAGGRIYKNLDRMPDGRFASPAACAGCPRKNSCPGVMQIYVDHYGDAEFGFNLKDAIKP
jgi:MoaA/NifB/PqqE/SkfB family radical SAM enzyme